MSLFNRFIQIFSSSNDDVTESAQSAITINPASGQMMVGGIGGIDTAGNTYGFNHQLLHDGSSFLDHSSFSNDSFGSVGGGWND